MQLAVVILAAGRGQRMRSKTPKICHQLAGQSLLSYVISTARSLSPQQIIVVLNPEQEQIAADYAADDITWCWQPEARGTGDAVKQALATIRSDKVLVLYGDVPLVRTEDLQRLLSQTSPLSLLTMQPDDPRGLGRVLRQNDHIMGIVEERDASPEQRQIKEAFSGIMVVDKAVLETYLPQLTTHNAQQEYYLTDLVKMLASRQITASIADDPISLQGINDKMQLAFLERYHQRKQAEFWMQQGVRFADPARFDLRGTLTAGQDVFIDVNVILEGDVHLGDDVHIGANCILKDVTIADGVVIKPNSMLEQAEVAERCQIGPFARVRPGTKLAEGVRIGNFVELKKAVFGKGSKANHLAYVGDSILGQDVNIGAGVITCNYDGKNKYQTTIEDGAFIGSNSSLIAPITIGEQAFVAAGSAVSKSVKKNSLTLTRAKIRVIEPWSSKHLKDE